MGFSADDLVSKISSQVSRLINDTFYVHFNNASILIRKGLSF
jgi:hypothetical protein